MLRLIVLGLAAFLLIAAAVTLIVAPQIPTLLREGFPQPVWPAPGRFAEVTGAGTAARLGKPRAHAPGPWLERLFRESGGRAILAAHRGALVLEHYEDRSPTTRYNSYSMVKSVVAALVLKAIAERRIEGLEVPIGDLVPDLDPSLGVVTLRDVLEMRSGIIFDGGFGTGDEEGPTNPFGMLARLHVLGLDGVRDGLRGSGRRSAFLYRNINTALLGAALERIYAMPLADLLSDRLWRPAGAETAFWREYTKGRGISAYCCLYATPRDWIRVGLFLMRNGTKTAPFLPGELHRALLGRDLSDAAVVRGAYGLHVRHDVLDRSGEPLQGRFTHFHGQGGQVLYLVPDEDLVVVRFGDRPQLLHSTLYAVWRTIRPEETRPKETMTRVP